MNDFTSTAAKNSDSFLMLMHVFFSIDRDYDFNLIEVDCRYLEQIVNNCSLTFAVTKYQFIVFGNTDTVDREP